MIVDHVFNWRDGIDGLITEEFTQSMQVFGPGVVGEQSVMTDAVEACGQHVNEEAPDELVGGQGQGLVAMTAFGAIVLPLEGDTGLIASEQAAVADGDPMGVTRQVSEHGLGSGERLLGIDDPFGLA